MDGTNTAENQTFDAAELGAMMREMRENLGHELADVASDLRIRMVYLEAIEAGRLADLPGNAYASGFLRAYSDYLGLDGDEIMRRFRMAGVDMSNQTQLHLPSPVEEGRLPTGPILLLAAIVAGAAYGGWYFFSTSGTGSVSSVAELPAELSRLIENRAEEAPGGTPAPDAAAPSVPTPTMTVDRPTLPDAAVAAPAPSVLVPAPAGGSAAAESGGAPAGPPETAATPAPDAPAGTGSGEGASEPVSGSGGPAASMLPAPAPETASEPAPPESESAPPQQATLPSPPEAERDSAPVPETGETATAPAIAAPSAPPVASQDAPAAAASPPAADAAPSSSSSPFSSPAPAAAEPEAPAAAQPDPQPASPGAASAQPEPAGPPQVAAAPESRRIVVRATAESFVAVLTSDNQPLFSQLMRPGDSYEVPSGANLVLETGNAGGLEISVGGRTAPPLGPVGSIRRNVPLDAEKLLQGSY